MSHAISRLVYLFLVIVWASGPLLAAPLSRPMGAHPSLTPWGSTARAAALALEVGAWFVVGIVIRRSTADLAGKLVTRASAAVGDYKDGVANSGQEWAANTAASEANYEMGVQEAIAKKRFGKGVQKAGPAKFVKNASELGAMRYVPGITQAKEAWQRGVEPAFNVLKSLQLPPKGPKRSPQNRERSAAVQIALGALKDSN